MRESRPSPDPDRLLAAELRGTAEHHAKWRELTEEEHAAAVAELRDLAALLAAGRFVQGQYVGSPALDRDHDSLIVQDLDRVPDRAARYSVALHEGRLTRQRLAWLDLSAFDLAANARGQLPVDRHRVERVDLISHTIKAMTS
jgi:hypothetical protein